MDYGLYWITLNEPDGILKTVAEYRPAYSWEQDQRPSFQTPGSARRYFQTQDQNASNAIKIHSYVGKPVINSQNN